MLQPCGWQYSFRRCPVRPDRRDNAHITCKLDDQFGLHLACRSCNTKLRRVQKVALHIRLGRTRTVRVAVILTGSRPCTLPRTHAKKAQTLFLTIYFNKVSANKNTLSLAYIPVHIINIRMYMYIYIYTHIHLHTQHHAIHC